MDQLELGSDGFMTIKKDSILSKFNTTNENNPVSKAIKLLADFRNRVISVNKKDRNTILPIAKIPPVTIPSIALGSTTVRIMCHLLEPSANEPSL